MQAKGLVRFFLVALLIGCLYQLSFTWVASNQEKKAETYAMQAVADIEAEGEKAIEKSKARKRYLDSISNETIFNLGVTSFTYQEVKDKQLKLGLDLQGGMSVVLQVMLQDLIKAMADDNPDPLLQQAIDEANKLQETSANEDYVSLFQRAFESIDPNARLSTFFATQTLQDRIDLNSTNEEVIAEIRVEAEEAVQRAYEIIRTRIDRFGVASPTIALQASSGRILVELPGVDDPAEVRKLLQATAKLEFWEVREVDNDIFKAIGDINQLLKDEIEANDDTGSTLDDAGENTDTAASGEELAEEGEATEEIAKEDVAEAEELTDAAEGDLLAEADTSDNSLLGDESTLGEDSLATQNNNPLFDIFSPNTSGGGVLGFVNGTDTSKFNEIIERKDVRGLLPSNVKLLLSAKPANYLNNSDDDDSSLNNMYEVYAIESRSGANFKAPLEGDVITDASADFDFNQQLVITMQMNNEGANKWRKLTAENLQENVAIVLDDQVYSAPTVQSEIAGGNSQITGNFTTKEANLLANILKSGKLPAETRIVEEAVVGPTMGAENIRNSLISLVAGLLLVLVFMVMYYSTGGVVAIIALLLNLFFVIGVLASLGAVLTLPGMAGIVLTIGMAVDANVIIFERIREELYRGSGIKKAIADGYSKSYSAIIDANLTTLITAAILFYFGLGPVLGFATILMIGIFSSLFTAILITRLVIDWWMGRGGTLAYQTGISKGAFQNLNFNFLSKRKTAYIASGAIIAIGILSILFRGFELGVDFSGGYNQTVKFEQDVSTNEIANLLTDPFGGRPVVRQFGTGNQVKITTQYLIDSTDENAADQVIETMFTGLKPIIGENVTLAQFTDNYLQSSQKVGPTIADDIRTGAIWATIFALLGIFFYILIRFRGWQYGLAAVITIIHDTLILLTLFSIFPGILPFSLEIDQAFIAALLTVIGYSINDTVVVFDRIREYLQLNPRKRHIEVVNDAVNSTLSRTVITSLTTLIVVLILFLFGGTTIKGFSFALLVGIIVGTYSSIFVATPVMVDLSEAEAARRAKLAEKDTSRQMKRGGSNRKRKSAKA